MSKKNLIAIDKLQHELERKLAQVKHDRREMENKMSRELGYLVPLRGKRMMDAINA